MSYDNPNPQPAWQHYRVGQGILIENNTVLLAANRWYSGQPLIWTLPGGRADDGEGVARALVREFKEETGLDIEVLDLAYVAEARSAVSKRLFLTLAYTVRRLSGTLSCDADDAVEQLQFVPFPNLPQYLTTPTIAEPLTHHLSNPNSPTRYWFYPEYSST